ncbi:MAG TPA: hypothetical protein DDW23_02100 [Planctomycetes bacterium]|nr:hypothetical protein [Planctomycetota bacterium]
MPGRPLSILTADSLVESACREAAAKAGEQAVSEVQILENVSQAEGLEGLVVVDPRVFSGGGVHEWCLKFLRENRALLFLLTAGNTGDADGLARFVGAQGALGLPPNVDDLASRLASPFGAPTGPRPVPLPEVDARDLEGTLAAALSGGEDEDVSDSRQSFLAAVCDSETGLYSADFWRHRLDEEFKRSNRFRFPLGICSFAFDGEVDDGSLLDIASIILTDTRDVDVVARFGLNTFVALLPHTGPEGARLFVERVEQRLSELGLEDLVGDSVEWNTAVAMCPDAELSNSDAFLSRVLPAQLA